AGSSPSRVILFWDPRHDPRAMSNAQRTAFAFVFALFASACSSSPANGTPTGSTCPQSSALTYANFGQTFLDNNCLACHASRERPTLTTQAMVQAERDAIDRAAAAGPNATNTIMPQDHDVAV